MSKPKLLFVDDDESIRQTLPSILTAEGFDCTTVATVSEALWEISRQSFDILLSDLNIGEPGDGFTVVGAMRRTQPQARTYILTGYPDFASALEAIRRQVDDYLVKPANIPVLVKTLKTQATRPRSPCPNCKRASTVIRENTEAIIETCFREVDRDPELAQINLPRSARIDHLPGVLRQLANRLDMSPDIDHEETESAWAHGQLRRHQGYSVPLIVKEARILYRVIADTLHANLLDMDVSSIIPDLILISDSLNVMLAESVRSFLAGEQIAAWLGLFHTWTALPNCHLPLTLREETAKVHSMFMSRVECEVRRPEWNCYTLQVENASAGMKHKAHFCASGQAVAQVVAYLDRLPGPAHWEAK